MSKEELEKKLNTIEKDILNLKASIDRGEQSTIENIQEYLDEILEDDFGFVKIEGKRCCNSCNDCKHYGCLSRQTHWDPAEYGCSVEDDLNDSNYFETKQATYCKEYGISYSSEY